jgi:hypothetical protein
MAKTTQACVMLYLAKDKHAALKELISRSERLQADLLREAVDDLLIKYRPTKAAKGVRAK